MGNWKIAKGTRHCVPWNSASLFTKLLNYPITKFRSGSFLRHNDRLLWRQRLAGVGWHRHQQLFFAINEVAGVEGGQFETVSVRDGVRGAGLNAITAEDAAVVVDV